MKLLSLKIHKAETCGGLLDGSKIIFRHKLDDVGVFDPLCLVGPNGSGKSQVLQVIAEIFQAAYNKYLPDEERGAPNDGLEFELEYFINSNLNAGSTDHVRISKRKIDRRRPDIVVERYHESEWEIIENNESIITVLPSKVVGYTSGDNETLSLPFLSSRAGYAEKVGNNAKDLSKRAESIKDPRLVMIDYGTNLEVLVANLLLSGSDVREALLKKPNLLRLRSFRCVIQLNHSAIRSKGGVKLTQELENYISYLKRCSTCFDYNKEENSFIFDFFVTAASNKAFSHYWKNGSLELFSCFHKLAMLNDLIIPKKARKQYEKGVNERRFAMRLPEPFDEHKVFRFERVEFISNKNGKNVDYVSLSDGEHQLAQLLGTAAMLSSPNVVFLMDEPESHFNPRWRVEFIKTLRNLPTNNGQRSVRSTAAQQECLITTHSPFVPSDMQSDNVLIFKKDEDSSMISVRRPKIQTYGSRFDAILAECFDISPPISALSRDHVDSLLQTGTAKQIRKAISELGESTARMRLAARLAQLENGNK